MSLFKLAFRNIKKSIKDYSIYFITLVIAISIFYLFNSLDSQTAMLALNESTKKMVQALVNVISSLSIFVAIVLGFLIVYANNFIIKRRKKEIVGKNDPGSSNDVVSDRVFHRERGTGGAGCCSGNDRQGVFADRPAPAAGIYPDVVSADLYQ